MGIARKHLPRGVCSAYLRYSMDRDGLQRACHSDPLSVTELSEKDCAEVLFIARERDHMMGSVVALLS
jgi:hypothetical protein